MKKNHVLLSFIALSLVGIAACSGDPEVDEILNQEEEQQEKDRGDETDGNWSIDDLQREYESYPSEVASDECTSLEDGAPSEREISPNQALTLSFDCLIDNEQLSVSVGAISVATVQISPTMIGFLIPGGIASGEQIISVSRDAEIAQFTVAIAGEVISPAEPRTYLNEVLDLQKELVEQISDSEVKERILVVLDNAEEQMAALSDEELRETADVIAANEYLLGLEQNAICQIQGSTPEAWWTCFQGEIRRGLKWAAGSSLLAGGGLTLLGTPFAPAGILLSGIGFAGVAIGLTEIADDMLAMTYRVIQVINEETLNIGINKTIQVDSGAMFTLEVMADYITFSGASMGEDARGLVAFLQVINEARDLITRVNNALGIRLEMYSLGVGSVTEQHEVDSEYVHVFLHENTSDEISADMNGLEVTLCSTSSSPEPVTLIIHYEFPEVRSVSTTVDVVVPPSDCCANDYECDDPGEENQNEGW